MPPDILHGTANFTTGLVTNLTNAWTTMLGVASGLGYPLCVISYSQQLTLPILGVRVVNTFSYQTRRDLNRV